MSWFLCAPRACSSLPRVCFPPAMSTNQSRPQCSGKLSPMPCQCGLSVCRRGHLSVSLYCVSNKFLEIMPSVMISFPGPVAQLLMLSPGFGVWRTLSEGCLCLLSESRRSNRLPPNWQQPFSGVGCDVLLLPHQPHPENVVVSGSCAPK